MKTVNFVKLGALLSALLIALSAFGCTTTGSNNSSSSKGDSSTDQKPAEIVAGSEGWYVLEEKTIDGSNITSTFIANAMKLEDGKVYIHTADYGGLKTEEGTYTVSGNDVTVTIGIKPYKYVFNAEDKTMEFNGKISKQQVKMRYKYSNDFALSDNLDGVNFTDRLFGESLDENFYNYCPTALMEGNDTMHVWYCSNKVSGNVTDYIGYRKGTLTDNGKWIFTEKQLVLSPTAGTWDERHVCDPSVVKGTFEMGGENYNYLMAYLGCKTSNVTCNEVGIAVAKNPEGPWVKVDSLNPIANFYTSEDYSASAWGYGQPCVISSDLAGKVFLIYTKGVSSGTFAYIEEWDFTDLDSPVLLREVAAPTRGVVNASGGSDVINNADFAYDPHLQRLYCVKEDFPYPTGSDTNWITNSNTILYIDLGLSGFDTLFTECSWNVAGKVTESATGFKRNHNMGILTDAYGRILNPYQIPILYTMSDLASQHPDWNAGGQWPALHTYRIHGLVIETR